MNDTVVVRTVVKKGEQQNKGATGFKAGGKNEKLQLATREEPKLRRGERKARRESGKRWTKTEREYQPENPQN